MKRVMASTVVAAIMATAGCAGVEMSPADRAQIKTIKIRVDDRMPNDMFYHGRAQSVAGAFGAIGALSGLASSSDLKAQIIATMKANNIQLPIILQAEFSKAMQSQKEFQVVEGDSSADAEMLLVVTSYGLGQSHGFSSLYPTLRVGATLRKPDNTVIWLNSDYATALNKENTEGHEFNEYIEQPELLRVAWSNVSGIVSRMLVRNLSPPR
jgi:hypothetical protein